jgi:hypothetical protein
MGLFNIGQTIVSGITTFLTSLFNSIISFFGNYFTHIWSTSLNIVTSPLVQNGIHYSQVLAITILGIKAMNEGFQTYILHEAGDPSQDPKGLIVRTGQAVAVIATLPEIVTQIFTFGTKVAVDVANLSTVQISSVDWTALTNLVNGKDALIMVIFLLIIAICFIVISIQASIRGAELALMAVLGPIMALNLSSSNRSIWSAWFKQVVIICCTQALQLYLIQGFLALLISQTITADNLIFIFGWLWVTIKSPKYIQQFAYSSGFTGTVGGTAKQAGTMVMMRRMMASAA